MPYRLDPSRPPPDEVRRVVAEQLARAIGAIDDAHSQPPQEVVRQVRVCCKRARGVLRLARGPLADAFQAENKSLAAIARSLARARDAQAVLDAFDAIAPPGAGPCGVALVRATLDAQRDLETADAADQSSALADARVRLEDALGRVPGLPLDTLRAADLWNAYAQTYRRTRRAMRGALANPDPVYSHDWRTWAKRHWYHVRLLKGASPKPMRERARRLDRFVDRLGRRHDLDLLRDRLRDPEGPLHALPASGWVLARAERAAGKLTLRGVREGLELFSDKPGALTRPLAAKWKRRARASG